MTRDPLVVDLFAGPGGWDFGAAALGLEPLGFELDQNACNTREAAGLHTAQEDLATYELPEATDLAGLIASPPCPAFSTAGKRDGVDWLPHLCEVAAGLAELDEAAPIEATLSLKPLEWVLRHRPRWVAWEQVPPILPLWQTCAHRMRAEGYSTWSGVLCAADYGVPQTRRRAILLASLHRDVSPPEPTHAQDPTPSLFGELKPWMSMADALRWDPAGTRDDMQTRSFAERAPTFAAKSGGQWRLGFARRNDKPTDDEFRERDYRNADEPANTITEKARSMTFELRHGSESGQRATRRDLDQPAGALAFGNAASDWRWLPKLRGGDSAEGREWTEHRPATTIAGDPRVWPPGHKINQDDIDRLGLEEAERRYGKRSGTNEGPDAIHLHPTEAAVLQSFPASYPFQGSKTAQFKQIGNAVPPLFAAHLLAAVTGLELDVSIAENWWNWSDR